MAIRCQSDRPPSPDPASACFLIDVDETLLNNDAVCDDLKRHLVEIVGEEGKRRYWELFEQLWTELGYADYLGRCNDTGSNGWATRRFSAIASYLLHYPFHERLYPGALETIAALRRRAPVVILTDGDAVHQPNKIERSGIGQAVDGHVLIYVHKEEMLDDIERRYPAEHYVMVDDKLRILTAMKAQWQDRLTTVFVRQGHYALDPAIARRVPAADADHRPDRRSCQCVSLTPISLLGTQARSDQAGRMA